jgi:hypothetical protein
MRGLLAGVSGQRLETKAHLPPAAWQAVCNFLLMVRDAGECLRGPRRSAAAAEPAAPAFCNSLEPHILPAGIGHEGNGAYGEQSVWGTAPFAVPARWREPAAAACTSWAAV